jgi:hypothetical protein
MCIECNLDKAFTAIKNPAGSYEDQMCALYHEGFTVDQLTAMFPGFSAGVIADMIEVWA